jgi:hypothetical protein
LGSGLGLPEFGGEETGETVLLGDLGETGSREWGGMVREVGGAEACQEAEGEVESADEEPSWQMHCAGGYAEVGDEPECVGGECGLDAVDERVEFWLGEAVEEEVSDHKIVWAFEGCGEGVGLVSSDVCFRRDGFAALAQEFEHRGADVDCVGMQMRVVLQELGEEATVSVAQDECVALGEKLREEVKAAVFKAFAEGEVFEPAIGTGYRIEVGLGAAHWWRKGSRRRGVVRARSAVARRVVRAMV